MAESKTRIEILQELLTLGLEGHHDVLAMKHFNCLIMIRLNKLVETKLYNDFNKGLISDPVLIAANETTGRFIDRSIQALTLIHIGRRRRRR